MSRTKEGSLRWDLAGAEKEFPAGAETISKRLTQLGEMAGEDGKFSTRQICAAVYGDKEIEKARLAREQADRIALNNAERRRTLIPVADAARIAQKFTFAARQKILTSKLSAEEKNETLGELEGLAKADFAALPEGEV